MAKQFRGLCKCGCGNKTNIITEQNKNRGLIKGNYREYVVGHHRKGKKGLWVGDNNPRWNGGKTITTDGYNCVVAKDHPYSQNGFIKEHRLIVEKLIGKILPKNAVVHHVNGNKTDNLNTNLVVCENNSYHLLLHWREKALRECGNANWRKCKFCHRWDKLENLVLTKNKSGGGYHYVCRREYREKRKMLGLSV